jgi:murein DD-endopeptidase MepM/ murein hydrolase activator NlpD
MIRPLNTLVLDLTHKFSLFRLALRQKFLNCKFQLMIQRNPLHSVVDGLRFERSLGSFVLISLVLLLSSYFVIQLFASLPAVPVKKMELQQQMAGALECVENPKSYLISMDKEQEEKFRNQALKLGKLPGLTVSLHVVQDQENFWSIASKYNVNIDTIIGANPYLTHYYARKGQELVILNRKGALHIVRKGENLSSIATLYGVEKTELKKANGLGIFTIKPGTILFVPDAYPRMLTPEMAKTYSKRHIFCSPIGGKYTSGFGWRTHPVTGGRNFHTGLDFRARYGAPISAAASGVVAFSGEAGGYGKLVIIQHKDGYQTYYAHNSSLLVSPGQKVRQGQIISRAGDTGTVNATHLHFEIRKDGQPVNPAAYLW